MILITKWFGVFLCDGEKIIKKRLMPENPQEIAEKLAHIQRGGILPEEEELAQGIEKLYVSDRRQSLLGKPTLFDSSFIKAEDFGFGKDIMHEAMMSLGRLRTSEPIGSDRSAVQAVRFLDDIIETCNLMNERLHEWYGIHFPELADYAKDRRYAELISMHGHRSGIIDSLDLDIESMGAELEDNDMDAVRSLANDLCMMYDSKTRMEEYISDVVGKGCPNLCYLIGGPLAARLISLAGGLDRLASLPSSTVQMLGAEKAMFRHLKSGKKPPKHGVIYQHPEVHRSPYWQRGNISRALACKISIAARIDSYGGEFAGEKLKTDFLKRVGDVKKKYPAPPKKPVTKGFKGKKHQKRRNGGGKSQQ